MLVRLAHKPQETRVPRLNSNKITLGHPNLFPLFSIVLQVGGGLIYHFKTPKVIKKCVKFILTVLNEFQTRLVNACK